MGKSPNFSAMVAIASSYLSDVELDRECLEFSATNSNINSQIVIIGKQNLTLLTFFKKKILIMPMPWNARQKSRKCQKS